MTFRIKAISTTAIFIAFSVSAQAAPTAVSSVFATGPSGTSGADSVTIGDGSVWIEYGNGVDSTGIVPGNSTIVQYGLNGAVLHTYSIAGSVDGLKFNPATGAVWALQNQDANATLSLINPSTHVVAGPLKYAAPPYAYGANSGPPPLNNGRGYDDVAFLGGKVYLSYTNPARASDPAVQLLDQGNTPSGTLTTTTTILTAGQTGLSSATNQPDIDSLKTTPGGGLVLTSGADGAFTLISNPGAVNQTERTVQVSDGGANASNVDDVLFPGVTQGTLFVTDTPTNKVYEVKLTGLDPNTPIVSIDSLHEVAWVNPLTGAVEAPLLSGISSPHGLDFIPFAVPEPSTWAMMLFGFAGLGFMGYRASAKRRAALAA